MTVSRVSLGKPGCETSSKKKNSLLIKKVHCELRKKNIDKAIVDVMAIHENGDSDRAEYFYKKILSIDPKHADSLHLLGILYHQIGENKRAIPLLKRAVEANPYFVQAHRHLAEIRKHKTYDGNIQLMENLFHDNRAGREQKIQLGFALGKAFEDLKEYQKSFHYLSLANNLKRMQINYQSKGSKNYFEGIKKTFSQEFFRQNNGKGSNDSTPIFILGMPRSGTSLVEQILASHSTVYGAGELNEISRLVATFERTHGLGFASGESGFDQKCLADMGKSYLKNLKGQTNTNEAHITDKMPSNFIYLGLIKVLFPNAKIIHCQRSPTDTCFSIYKHLFTGKHNYAYDLKELGEYYNAYLDLMEHWKIHVPNSFYNINYEELVSDPKRQIRELLAYCDLTDEISCHQFHQNKRVVHTASSNQVRKPIYQSAVKHCGNFEEFLNPLLSTFDIQKMA